MKYNYGAVLTRPHGICQINIFQITNIQNGGGKDSTFGKGIFKGGSIQGGIQKVGRAHIRATEIGLF